MLWHNDAIVEGVAIDTLRCIGDESTRIFWLGRRLVRAGLWGSLELL